MNTKPVPPSCPCRHPPFHHRYLSHLIRHPDQWRPRPRSHPRYFWCSSRVGCPHLSKFRRFTQRPNRTYGDYYFTASGFLLTLLGTLLAALKTIYTSVLQSRSKNPRPTPPTPKIPEPATWRTTTSRDYFPRPRSTTSFVNNLRRLLVPPSLDLHPLDLLTRMSPLAFVQCVIYAQMSGELDRLSRLGVAGSFPPSQDAIRSSDFRNVTYNSTDTLDCTHALRIGGIPFAQVAVLLLNGCIAFGLNVVSFSANGKVGALSMTVAG